MASAPPGFLCLPGERRAPLLPFVPLPCTYILPHLPTRLQDSPPTLRPSTLLPGSYSLLLYTPILPAHPRTFLPCTQVVPLPACLPTVHLPV